MKIRFKIDSVELERELQELLNDSISDSWFDYLVDEIKIGLVEQPGRIFEVLKRGDSEIIRATHTSNGTTSDSIEISVGDCQNDAYFDYYFTSSRKPMAIVVVTFRTSCCGLIIITGKFSEVLEAPFGDFDDHGVFQIKLGE